MIPGRTLHRLAACVCSAKMLERIVEPAIADLQNEYAEAPANARLSKVSVLVSGYAAVLEVMAMAALEMPAVANERRVLMRTFLWAAGVTASAAGLLIVLTLAQTAYVSTTFLNHVAYVTPQALPIAIPIGLTLGIAFGLNGGAVSHRTRKVVLLAALLASAISFGTLEWVMPAANQSYRQAMYRAWGGRGMVTKGSNEMTLAELRGESNIARGQGEPGKARWLEWNYHLRWALSCATLVLAVFAFALMRRGGTRRAVVMAACVMYFILLFMGEVAIAEGLPPILGAWLPNLTFGLAAMAMLLRRNATDVPRFG